MASFYEKGENRLLEDLAKKAETNSSNSRLLVDLATKRKVTTLSSESSQLVKDLKDKKAIEKNLLQTWKESDEESKEKIKNAALELLGHPLEISKLTLDLEERATKEAVKDETKNT